MSYVSHTDAWSGRAVAVPFAQWLAERGAENAKLAEAYAAGRTTLNYRYDPAAVGATDADKAVAMGHCLACWIAAAADVKFSLVPTAEEAAAAEREAQAWNPPDYANGRKRYHGD